MANLNNPDTSPALFSPTEPDLWRRLQACELDDPGASFPFSRRLARENGWPHAFAQRVITEYLKFAYLSQLGKGPVTPSDEVDQVWHLHLTYTRHYWGRFTEAMGAPLHHGPTSGGSAQASRFEDLYAKTLALYRREFGEPPKDIWPSAKIRFTRPLKAKRINAEDVWVIPKPGFLKRLGKRPDKANSHGGRRSARPALAAAALIGATGAALAHSQPAGDTGLERLFNRLHHWFTEHTVNTLAVTLLVLALAWGIYTSMRDKRGKGSDRGSSGCSSSSSAGSSSSDGDSGSSGCSGCGGGD